MFGAGQSQMSHKLRVWCWPEVLQKESPPKWGKRGKKEGPRIILHVSTSLSLV